MGIDGVQFWKSSLDNQLDGRHATCSAAAFIIILHRADFDYGILHRRSWKAVVYLSASEDIKA